MANILKFEIKTEAPYSDEEQIDLLESFVAFMRGGDDDIVEDSEKLSVIDENDVPDESDKIRAQAIELIKLGTLNVGVTLLDADEEELLSAGFSRAPSE